MQAGLPVEEHHVAVLQMPLHHVAVLELRSHAPPVAVLEVPEKDEAGGRGGGGGISIVK